MPLFFSSLIHWEQMFFSIDVLQFPICSVSLTSWTSAGALDFHGNTCSPRIQLSLILWKLSFRSRRMLVLWVRPRPRWMRWQDVRWQAVMPDFFNTRVVEKYSLDIGVRLLSVETPRLYCLSWVYVTFFCLKV